MASFDAFGLEFALTLSSYANTENTDSLPLPLRIVLQQLEKVAANLLFVKIALLAAAMGFFSILAYLAKGASHRLPNRRIVRLLMQHPFVGRIKHLVRSTPTINNESEDCKWGRERLHAVQQISATQRDVSQSVAEYLVQVCDSSAMPETTVDRITLAFNGLLYSIHQDKETAQQHRAVIEEFIANLKQSATKSGTSADYA